MTTKPKHDYTKLDEAIIGAIAACRHEAASFCDISPKCEPEAEKLSAVPGEAAEWWRIIDRRLQALRKAGKIRHTTKGWVLS